MKSIELTQGHVAIVDDEDFEYLNQWKWHSFILQESNTIYAARTHRFLTKRTTVLMHRQVVDAVGMEIDHINGNGLDNRKENLRICTRQENSRNVNRNNKNGYKGVHKSGKKFIAQIWVSGECKHLGTFQTAKEAAVAYDKSATEFFGSFAHTNF